MCGIKLRLIQLMDVELGFVRIRKQMVLFTDHCSFVLMEWVLRNESTKHLTNLNPGDQSDLNDKINQLTRPVLHPQHQTTTLHTRKLYDTSLDIHNRLIKYLLYLIYFIHPTIYLNFLTKLELSNVDVILADVTKFEFETEKQFDRILVIEAIEHMKNIQLFMKKISKWMKDENSLLFVEHLCHKTFSQHFEAHDEDDWYTSFVLPKGSVTLLSASALLYFQDDVSVVDHWVLNGMHMARSNEEWAKKFDRNLEVAKEVLKPGLGSEEAVNQVITNFKTFLIGNVVQFSLNNGEEWMVSHVLFKKK
ncbi:hypothetical protein MKW94_019699 [Papaver nudicaule]|uniref:Uncharacterized protein n=1 Tax=Papaver nudicaule TaxID=74823 RepID=A0AA41V361_PAPNU|nr:hypothetical protein [Papaver nudicaule]